MSCEYCQKSGQPLNRSDDPRWGRRAYEREFGKP